MNVTLATIRVVGNPLYDSVCQRWLDTYRKFKPAMQHDLLVVNSGGDRPDGMFDDVASRYVQYNGGGWDVGAWQFLGKTEKSDLLICTNTSCYFHRSGWMERFVEEATRHGDGLYGSMASYECFPHIRTPCYVFQPKVIRDYPLLVDSRPKTYTFECLGGKDNFTLWCRSRGYRTLLVTWDGCYDIPQWRTPPNIFRRGDQSNILVKDRHVDHYEVSDQNGKKMLAQLADRLTYKV